jgi:hypothetical protein
MDISIVLNILFIVAYLIVVIIQSNHIKSLKKAEKSMLSSNELMKSANNKVKSYIDYVDVFDTEKANDYVKMNEDTARLTAANFAADNEKLKNFTCKIMNEQTRSIQEFYIKEIGEEYSELLTMVLNVLWQNRNDKNNYNLILNQLPKSKYKLLSIISEWDNNAGI